MVRTFVPSSRMILPAVCTTRDISEFHRPPESKAQSVHGSVHLQRQLVANLRALRGRPSPERRPRHALAFRPGRSLIAAPSGPPSTPYWVYRPSDFPQRSAVVCVVRRHCVRSCSSILSFSEGYAAVRFSCFWPASPDPSSALSPVKKAAHFPFCSQSLQVVRLSVVPPVRAVAGAFQRQSEHRPPRRPAQLPPARSFRPAQQVPWM
ncbi:hypothetical protein VTN00DRAFT_1455 [Thermoascus crustaceus]|uniref:uncharacterized protein n=1 Tax=Thermoascus crustaceus TaxID=5088 RepID=UPI0037433ACE